MSEQKPIQIQPSAQTPEDSTVVPVDAPSKAAGGFLLSSPRLKLPGNRWCHTRRADLLTLIKDGFDCPGCAWPEPDDERSHADFVKTAPSTLLMKRPPNRHAGFLSYMECG